MTHCRRRTFLHDLSPLLVLTLSFVPPVHADKPGANSSLLVSVAEKGLYRYSMLAIRSHKYGMIPDKERGQMTFWYQATPGFRDRYQLMIYTMDVRRYDEIELTYKLGKTTTFAIDLWFDGKQLVPRHHLPRSEDSEGLWHTTRIAVRGKQCHIALGLNQKRGQEPTDASVHEVTIKDLRGIRHDLQQQEPQSIAMASIKLPLIIPSPKKLTLRAKPWPMADLNAADMVLVLPLGNSLLRNAIAKQMIGRLADLTGAVGPDIPVVTGTAAIPATAAWQFIFELSQTPPANHTDASEALNNPEGYLIRCQSPDGTKQIHVQASTYQGLYWACQTVFHLLQPTQHGADFYVASISDWPGFAYRAMGGSDVWRYKSNVHHFAWWRLGQWDAPTDSYKALLQKESVEARAHGRDLLQGVSPYKTPKGKAVIRCSNQDDIERLFATFKISLDLGSQAIVLSFDDPARAAELPGEDVKAFNNDKRAAQAHLVAELARRLTRDYPGVTLFVTPENYTGSSDVYEYYDKAGVPKEVVVFWTGADTVTLTYTAEEVARFSDHMQGRRFAIFDNTPSQMHGMYRGVTFGDLFARDYDGVSDYAWGLKAMFRINYGHPKYPYPELSTLLGLCIAEYQWNPTTYNAKLARQRAIAFLAGGDAVAPMLKLIDAYQLLLRHYPVEKLPTDLSPAEISRYAHTDEDYQRVRNRLTIAQEAVRQFTAVSTSTSLSRDISNCVNRAERMMAYLHEHNRLPPAFDPVDTIHFDLMTQIKGGVGYRTYSWKCPPRLATWIYGTQTSNHTLAINFTLNAPPDTDAQLILEGQNDDKPGDVLTRIRVNDTVLLQTSNPFQNMGWSTITLDLPQGQLRKGLNVIVIENLADSAGLASQWVMIADAKIVFDQAGRKRSD